MIAIPSTSITNALVAHIRSSASSICLRCNDALSGGGIRDWPTALLVVMTALNGWLTVGLVPQSALLAASATAAPCAQMSRHLGRTNTAWSGDTGIRDRSGPVEV